MLKDIVTGILSAAIGISMYAYLTKPDTPKPAEKTATVTKVIVNPGVPERIGIFHDDIRGVTCYEGKQSPLLSCVPDIQLRPTL